MQFHWIYAKMNYVMYYLAEWTRPNASHYLCPRQQWRGSAVIHHLLWQPQLYPVLFQQRVLTEQTAGHRYNCILALLCFRLVYVPPLFHNSPGGMWCGHSRRSLRMKNNINKAKQSVTNVTPWFGFSIIHISYRICLFYSRRLQTHEVSAIL